MYGQTEAPVVTKKARWLNFSTRSVTERKVNGKKNDWAKISGGKKEGKERKEREEREEKKNILSEQFLCPGPER